jgi:bifunctional DNA-binding transcriptional regulator/antitoxin component of YhaV-PrlF toxin-antitoxin module
MQLKNKQYILTIPKNIVNAMQLRKGDEIIFIFERGDILVRKKIN